MSSFLIDYSDYKSLVDLIAVLMQNNADLSVRNTFDSITSKYSLKRLINEYKRMLFENVKKYQEGSVENKRAYQMYKDFDSYIKAQYKNIDENLLTFDDVYTELQRITTL